MGFPFFLTGSATPVEVLVIVRKNITFPKDIEDKLSEYRLSRKSETGKVMFRETAVVELLRKALLDVKPATPIQDRLLDLEKRIQRLELSR